MKTFFEFVQAINMTLGEDHQFLVTLKHITTGKKKNVIKTAPDMATAHKKAESEHAGTDYSVHDVQRHNINEAILWHIKNTHTPNHHEYFTKEYPNHFTAKDVEDDISDDLHRDNAKVKSIHASKVPFKEEVEADIFHDNETDEDYIIESIEDEDGDIISERRIAIRVNSKGKRTRKVVCGPGFFSRTHNGVTSCVRMTGAQRQTKKRAIIKANRSKKQKGAGLQRRINIKRQRALLRRKSMGL